MTASTVEVLLEAHLSEPVVDLAQQESLGYLASLLIERDPSTASLVPRAQRDLATLLRLESASERAARVERAVQRFRQAPLAALLLDEAHRQLQDDPDEAQALARLAGKVAYRAGDIHLQALAAAAAGNSLRVAGRLVEASAEFEETRRLLSFVRRCPWLTVECQLLEASLLKDRRCLDEARRLLRRVLLDLRGTTRNVAIARAKLKLADLERMEGNAAAAVAAVVEALQFVEPRIEPRLHCIALFSLVANLMDAGRVADAADLLEFLRPVFFALMKDRLPRLRWCWLEGQVRLRRGDIRAAEGLFKEALVRYSEARNPLLAAFVALDLMVLLLEQGRTEEIRTMARPLETIFRSQNLRAEARSVLAVLIEAIARDRLTVHVAKLVQAQLRGLPSIANL